MHLLYRYFFSPTIFLYFTGGEFRLFRIHNAPDHMFVFFLSGNKDSNGAKTKSNRKTIEEEMLHDNNIIR